MDYFYDVLIGKILLLFCFLFYLLLMGNYCKILEKFSNRFFDVEYIYGFVMLGGL